MGVNLAVLGGLFGSPGLLVIRVVSLGLLGVEEVLRGLLVVWVIGQFFLAGT